MAEREQQIAKRLVAATPGPWGWFESTCGCKFIQVDNGSEHGGTLITSIDDSVNDADAELIANAPADLAYLLKENQRLRTELAGFKDDDGISGAPEGDYFWNVTHLHADLAAARAEVDRLRADLAEREQELRQTEQGRIKEALGLHFELDELKAEARALCSMLKATGIGPPDADGGFPRLAALAREGTDGR